jgi:hypothetical protein
MTNYRVHGITDDTDTCEVCGKTELRRVVMLAVLDADGNAEEMIYAGTTCAARKLAQRGIRVRAARIAAAAATANRVRMQASEWADEFGALSLNAYIAGNATAYLNMHPGDTTAALAAARAGYADMLAEVAAVRSGALAETRFAKLLPVL